MSLLEVLHFPDNRLRKKAIPFKTIDANCRLLAKDMLETMYDSQGIGLAATQVNIQKRLIVIDLSPEKNAAISLVNPEILSAEGATESQEGCLSVPQYYDMVTRAKKIKYRYMDLSGKVIEENANGLLAICIQHEVDHLDGKLFIDYLSPMKRQRLRKKLEKQEKFQATIL